MSTTAHTTLTRRERQIMDILYRRGRATAAEVLEDLPGDTHYSTVRTQLRVLEEKGHVHHDEEGLRYVYSPLVSRNTARKSALRHVVQTFFDGSAEKAVAALLGGEASRLSEDELRPYCGSDCQDEEGGAAMTRRLTVLAMLLASTSASWLSAQQFSTLSGSIVDQSGAALPGVIVIANNRSRGDRHEVATDRNGRFELIGLVQGVYVIEADLPGFETFFERVAIDGQDLSREITLQIGSLQEMVTVVNDPNAAPAAPSQRFAPLQASCGPSTSDAGGVRVGGQIRTPRKIRHVPPIYPQGSSPGVVTIEAMIGTDGFVQEARVTNDAADALARSAIDAVRQWEFDPTLLNCEAVNVRMSVTVDFQ